jgi:peptidoglycan/xylan/chitin deacetylase (PgdA/CDA1 family)
VRQPVTLIVSIDTEEDNWQRARSGITVQNIRELPRLHDLFQRLGVRATYFTSYQVATTRWAAELLAEIADAGTAEIGAHLHPWNTPPLEEPFEARFSMTMNLEPALQVAKIRALTQAVEDACGTRPVSFRAGRWGLGPGTGAALLVCGYRADSSVTPFVSWERMDGGPSYVGAPSTVYRLDGRGDPRIPVTAGGLIEVPVSCGYSRLPWEFWSRVYDVLAGPTLEPLQLVGVASKLGMVKRIILSPEIETVPDMLTLSRRAIERGARHLHLTWHSPSLCPGLSPFATSTGDVERLYAAVEQFVDGLSAITPVTFATVGEADACGLVSRRPWFRP